MMKQKLLKTIVLALAVLGGASSAWAVRDTEKPIYCPVNDGSYDYVLEAFNAIKDNAATELEIQIWGTRPKLGTENNSRINIPAGKTLSITPMVDGIILTSGSHNRSNIWFLNAQDNATFNIGSADHAMTIEGYGFNDNNTQMNAVCANEKKGVMNITNVTFQKFRFGTNNSTYGYVYANKVASTSSTEGYVTMTDVTITNCQTANDAFINSINTNNDAICLKGNFTINHKDSNTEPVFSLMGRIKLGDKSSDAVYSGFTAPNLITIVWAKSSPAIGDNVIVKVPESQKTGIFDVTNEGYGLVRSGNGGDMKLTQAYTLSVSEAGAATLVLPFESTIPTGATCYDLTYSSGDNINVTSVTTTLAKDEAVLVIANEGSYKFVSTATSGDLATGSGQTSANGVLIGNYDANYVVPTDGYILTNHSGTVAFRKVAEGNTNKIGANRAYMSVTYSSGGSNNAPAYYSIIFPGDGDNGTTAIMAVDVEKPLVDDGEIYNLQGVRMTGSNLPKGIYVKNGKKFVIK